MFYAKSKLGIVLFEISRGNHNSSEVAVKLKEVKFSLLIKNYKAIHQNILVKIQMDSEEDLNVLKKEIIFRIGIQQNGLILLY